MLLFLAPSLSYAAQSANLALNKKLTYTPKPGYSLTVHSRDPYILTDGIKGECLWYESYKEKTVGWVDAELIVIEVDLERICQIGQIVLHTVRGNSGWVQYPEYVVALCSTNGRAFSIAGTKLTEDWGFVWSCNKRGVSENKSIVVPVNQKARYIRLLIRPTGHHTFFDEVEVLASSDMHLNATSQTSVIDNNQVIEYVERIGQLQRNLSALEKRVEGLTIKEEQGMLFKHIQDQILELYGPLTDEQLETAEIQFGRLRARILNSLYKTKWFVYPADPLSTLKDEQLPPPVIGDCHLSFYVWQNEYAFETFNIVNASENDLIFSLFVSPLKGDNDVVESESCIQLRRACYVFSRGTGYFADPLVLQNSRQFTVKPGKTVQIGLELRSKNLASGIYSCAIAVQSGKEVKLVPVSLEIGKNVFPPNPPFMACSWDNLTHEDNFTKKNSKYCRY